MNAKNEKNRAAAILIASLDHETADVLLAQMTTEEAAAIRRAAIQLDEIDPVERDAVIDRFCRERTCLIQQSTATGMTDARHGLRHFVSEQNPPGIELDGSLARRLALPEREKAVPEITPFQFLHDTTPETLASLLAQEHPQTIAVVFSHLSPEQSADVLPHLPRNVQAEVIRRLADLDETDPEAVREVERSLESWLADQGRRNHRQQSGKSAVTRILQAADPHVTQALMDALKQRDATLAEQLQIQNVSSATTPAGPAAPPEQPADGSPVRLTFEDLTRLDDRALATVLDNADPQVSILALAGADPRVVERLIRRLGDREGKQLRYSLANLGPIRLSDVETAQERLATLAEQMAAEGRIQLPARQITAAA